MFRDPERCIQRILHAFAAAELASASAMVHETVDGIRELEQPPQRYGRPDDVDYEYDKARLLLPQMHSEINDKMRDITSTFVRRSVSWRCEHRRRRGCRCTN